MVFHFMRARLGQRGLVGYSSSGCKESTTNEVSMHMCMVYLTSQILGVIEIVLPIILLGRVSWLNVCIYMHSLPKRLKNYREGIFF